MTLKDVYDKIKNRSWQSEKPLSDYMILLSETLNIKKQDILINPDGEIDAADFENLCSKFDELEENRPIQYILGKWEFMGNTFYVGEGVLIPREDTSAAVELALEFLEGKKDISFLDLGSGSGCIAVTLSKSLGTKGYAVEKSKEAFEFLKKNIEENAVCVTAILGDMFEKSTKDKLAIFDLIISNPPYITKEDMDRLDSNVKKEPALALYGGIDGLDYYRKIIVEYKDKLKSGGALVFELGYNQMDAVIEILEKNGFRVLKEKKDINSIRRAVLAVI